MKAIAILFAGVFITYTLATAGPGPAKPATPAPPCKTPEELMGALQFALQKQDTNLFWKLFSWTNLSARDEKLHRALQQHKFKEQSNETKTFSSFRIGATPTQYNVPRILRNGEAKQFNLPLSGVFLFEESGRKRRDPLPTFFSYRGNHEAPFGKGADGNYWLAVLMAVSNDNSKLKIQN